MKIIYLHQYFNTPDMAGSTRSYEMARRLVGNGHEVHIVTSWRENSDESDWFSEDIDGIRVHWLPVPYSNKMSYAERISAFFSYAIRAGLRAKSIGGDIVFATSTPLTIAIPGVFVSKVLNIPMVFEVRDLWPELPIAIGALRNPITKFLARQLEKFAYKNSKKVVALSPGMAEGVINAGFNKDDVFVIPNSADLDVFGSSLCKKDSSFRLSHPEIGPGPIVLYAGTLGVINGVSYLAELAYRTFQKHMPYNFVVIGDGKEWELVKRLASDYGILGKNFFMYPSMPKNMLVSAFEASSISTSLFVDLKPMEANSANKFFDALASGKPVVINYGGWQEELLREHHVGIRLSRDLDSACLQISELLSSEKTLQTYGFNARRLAENKFSRDILAKNLENVLLSALT